MHKKKYNSTEIEILYFDKKDIITASGDPDLGGNDSSLTPANEAVIDSPLAQ